jgi:hypothetical protein
MVYSAGYRKAAIAFKQAGHTFKEPGDVFKITPIIPTCEDVPAAVYRYFGVDIS